MKKLFVSVVACMFLLSACGGGGGDQGEVADLFIQLAGDEGLELNEDCVREQTAKLSDDDAKALVDAGINGDPEISDEGDAIGDQIFSSCVDTSSYVDFVINSFTEEDDSLDADCLREAFDGLSVDEIDENLFDAAFACSGE